MKAAEWEVAVERPTYDLTVFKLHCGRLALKIYSKGERVLRIEAVAHNVREFHCGRLLDNFPEIVRRLKGMLEQFTEALSCIDQCFIGDEMLECLPLASRVGKSMVGGVDLNETRLRHVAEAVCQPHRTASPPRHWPIRYAHPAINAYPPTVPARPHMILRNSAENRSSSGLVRRVATRRFPPACARSRRWSCFEKKLSNRCSPPLRKSARPAEDKTHEPSIAITTTCDMP
jgi:hypothetical protein